MGNKILDLGHTSQMVWLGPQLWCFLGMFLWLQRVCGQELQCLEAVGEPGLWERSCINESAGAEPAWGMQP